jgi:hypothetical protein
MTTTILFFSHNVTPRLQYTVASIVAPLLGVEIAFTQDKNAFSSSNLPKINYSDARLTINEVFIQTHDLLFENNIKPILIENDADFFTHTNASNATDFDFDVFARIFFLVSRYEEYNRDASVFDVHQRFPSTQSVASKLNFLQQPLVNQYVIALSEKLKSYFPTIHFELPTYRFEPTFDIDRAWLYRNLGWDRQLGSFLKDILRGSFKNALKRVKILRGLSHDPYFTFADIQTWHEQHNLPLVVFWLLGDYAKFDKNIKWTNPEFQALIQAFDRDFKVGIHPSYRSNDDISILTEEVNRLKLIKSRQDGEQSRRDFDGGLEPRRRLDTPSRQHFLKLTFPETYRRLLSVGILEDWTMGYADETGFRASIATPFPWFDLEKNEQTRLMIHPFQAMDVTLNNYLKLSPEAATERLRTLIYTCREVGGTFTTLWHNDNLAEMDGWRGWKVVYERLLQDASEK